ncbi:bifunctional 3,4-dihydroxy-2-butanone-4-phosphate synthase/GTP cyclohydrolase II [Lentibacillus sp. L22]|uniref:bifunctional 3,4-dihydroxy-2-butanone-4-phosphate synthase/GTP cyclohydrolase II n=1 Tax=Lentibacillus TaxID=175304 RepID=UPI0022B0F846|nr:bifunctional 3,4-dihydroxy-2-butanone-4-phosphate synthase/GTP cyclohydrolase II [Lentibacillus daqui]
MFHSIDEAIADLKQGKPIIVVDDENRENEGDLVALSEKATPQMINFMITHAKGLVCTTMRENLAKQLGLSMMAKQNTDPFGTAFTVSIDHKDTRTGISAVERSQTIQALLHPDASAADFKQPGHVFPLIAKEGGVLVRTGHTEASVDLAELSGAFPSCVICEVIKEDGTMARVPDLMKVSEQHRLKIITIADLITYRKKHEKHVKREVEATLPTDFGEFRVIGYSNDLDDKEHIALVKGEISGDQPILTRIHSECLTGDVFGSFRCDCGNQLHEALDKINEAGQGVLVYMRQEGRGIGLLNKLRAYKLQENGMDTVEANEQLGFPPDLRDYDVSAQILLDLGVHRVELLTNNPEKMGCLAAHGVQVEARIPLQAGRRVENEKYMQTKQEKMGHLLGLHG